ncbi:MAG: alpha/beta hydrolase, partial [Bacteroidota bacterium]
MKKINMLFLFFALPFFAQDIISEEIVITNEAITLPGVLSYPKVQEKLPLVIFIHGSGNIDKDGNQSGINVKANYIKMLSDNLNQNGIAFFRYDKRTVRPENMNSVLKDNSYEYLVEDAKKVIAYFKEDIRFHQMILIGHSQGSLTAMLA